MTPVPLVAYLILVAGTATGTEAYPSFEAVRSYELARLVRGDYRLEKACLPVWCDEVSFVCFLDSSVALRPVRLDRPRRFEDAYVARYAIMPFARIGPTLERLLGPEVVGVCKLNAETEAARARATEERRAGIWLYTGLFWLEDPRMVFDFGGDGYELGEGMFILCDARSGRVEDAIVPVRLFVQLVWNDLERWLDEQEEKMLRRELEQMEDAPVPELPYPALSDFVCALTRAAAAH